MKLAGLFFLLIGIVIMVFLLRNSASSSGGSLTVTTDVTPVKLELGDIEKSVDTTSQKLSAPIGTYKYRASVQMDGKTVSLVDTVNVSKDAKLALSFKQLTSATIVNTLCANLGASRSCPFSVKNTVVSFAEGNTWAVSASSPVGYDKTTTVLRMNGGKWSIVEGPGTYIPTGGYYPRSVEEAINNAK